MKPELYNYEITPAVVLTGRHKTITIRPLGAHAAFIPGNEYVISVLEAERAPERYMPGSGSETRVNVLPSADGCLRFDFCFEREGMYIVAIRLSAEDKPYLNLRMYALAEDMKGLYPFRGDLHMHSCRSDGKEDPCVVAANYRGHGYDFTVISDHSRYYPSLETRKAFGIGLDDKSPITDMLIVAGEEIHLPSNMVHYVNFGGKFSINALVSPSKTEMDRGLDPAARSLDGTLPPIMTKDEYCAMLADMAKDIPLENENERLAVASFRWIYSQIKNGDGLGIFPHPYWLTPTQEVGQKFLEYLYRDGAFDAFEVLGGERYYQHNGFQTAFYYEMKARGVDYPVVGSTDSHGSTEHNAGALVCSTIVFARDNTTWELISSIKKKYSVAVDTISPEYRLVGDFRMIKYGSFLMENWYPLHDLLCSAEGTYLKKYILGDASAEKVLLAMKGQVGDAMKKYFDIED